MLGGFSLLGLLDRPCLHVYEIKVTRRGLKFLKNL